MSTPGRNPGHESPRVSPTTIPLLLLGLVIGFFAAYFLLWWGLLAVLAVCVIAFTRVLAGKSRDAATAAILGVVAGYLIVILLALFRGIL